MTVAAWLAPTLVSIAVAVLAWLYHRRQTKASERQVTLAALSLRREIHKDLWANAPRLRVEVEAIAVDRFMREIPTALIIRNEGAQAYVDVSVCLGDGTEGIAGLRHRESVTSSASIGPLLPQQAYRVPVQVADDHMSVVRGALIVTCTGQDASTHEVQLLFERKLQALRQLPSLGLGDIDGAPLAWRTSPFKVALTLLVLIVLVVITISFFMTVGP